MRSWAYAYVDLKAGRSYAGALANWGYQRYMQFFGQHVDGNGKAVKGVTAEQFAAVQRFYGADKAGQRIFVSANIDQKTPVEFLADVDATNAGGHPAVEVVDYNGDTMRLRVRADRPSWLSFVDNWDPNWTATVNGQPTPIELLFGSYKSVRIPAGASDVVFDYRFTLWPHTQ